MMSQQIDITGLSRLDVLKALYDQVAKEGGTLSDAEAELWLELAGRSGRVSEINSHPIRVKLAPGTTEFDPAKYDKKYGPGTAQSAITELRLGKKK